MMVFDGSFSLRSCQQVSLYVSLVDPWLFHCCLLVTYVHSKLRELSNCLDSLTCWFSQRKFRHVDSYESHGDKDLERLLGGVSFNRGKQWSCFGQVCDMGFARFVLSKTNTLARVSSRVSSKFSFALQWLLNAHISALVSAQLQGWNAGLHGTSV